MKRLLLALGLLLGIMNLSTAANAQVVKIGPCTQVNNVGANVYPYVMQCTGANATQSSAVFTALNNAPGQTTITTIGSGANKESYSLQSWMIAQQKAYKDKVTNNPVGGAFYVFDTPAHFRSFANTYFPAGLPIPTANQLSNSAGVTVYANSGAGPGLYTIIFTKIGTVTNNVPGTSAGHEVGHYMDFLFAATAGNAGSLKINLVSNTAAYYQKELTQDWNTLNAFEACLSNGIFGVFSNHADDTGLSNPLGPYYICDGNTGLTGYDSNGGGTALNTGYAGLSNEAVLQSAWAYFYQKGSDTNNQTQPWKELFAETYGAGSGVDGIQDFANSPNTADVYLGYDSAIGTTGGFVCTRTFISWLVQTNTLPKKASPPPGWPAGCPLF